MGSRIEHRAEFAQDIDAVLAALSDEAVLRARLKEIGGQNASLVEHTETAQGVRFKLRQGVAAEQIPQAVRILRKGDLVVEREQQFAKSAGGYTGTVTASVNGVPAEITARTELTSDSGGTVLATTGEVKVRVPLFGAKLESVVAEQVTNLLELEAEFTTKWLARHG
jgi:hypothetical protein